MKAAIIGNPSPIVIRYALIPRKIRPFTM